MRTKGVSIEEHGQILGEKHREKKKYNLQYLRAYLQAGRTTRTESKYRRLAKSPKAGTSQCVALVSGESGILDISEKPRASIEPE